MLVQNIRNITVSTEKELFQSLLIEFRTPRETGEPYVIITTLHSLNIQIFVIWSKWQGIEHVVRSRIIFDAFTEWKGEIEAQVTFSIGVTPEEAIRMGIESLVSAIE